ncbi:MAG: hypothetical protein ACKPHE_04805 [Microcystis panniformis]
MRGDRCLGCGGAIAVLGCGKCDRFWDVKGDRFWGCENAIAGNNVMITESKI